jgi:GNAT superfamily N-acetyltransferase
MIVVEAVTSARAALWHTALGGPSPAPAEMERLSAKLGGGTLAPELRLIASDAQGPFARCVAQRREKSIRLWMPEFRDGTPEAQREPVMARFLETLTEARQAANLAHIPLETEPGDDQGDIAPWLRALARTGFAEACAYRLHVLPRESFAAPRHTLPGLVVLSVEPEALRAVSPVLRRAHADTLERRDSGIESNEAYVAHLAKIGRGYEPGLWLMAEYRGAPAAAMIVNRAEEPPFPGTSAWVLEIGCVPELRGQGVAAALMAEVLARLARADCQRLLATIDERNIPSIRLHARFGFARQPERYYLYRRTA